MRMRRKEEGKKVDLTLFVLEQTAALAASFFLSLFPLLTGFKLSPVAEDSYL